MSLAHDVIQLLRRAIGAANNARDGTDRVKVVADEIIAEVRTATDGSSAEKPAEAIVRLEQAKVRLDEAIIEFQAGSAAAEEYIVEGIGGECGGTIPKDAARGGNPAPAEPPVYQSQTQTLPSFRHDRAHPKAVSDIKRIGWPKNPNGEVKAQGKLYDAQGRPLVDGAVLPASVRGPGTDVSDLREPWRSDERYKTRYHVEGHTAALMRRRKIKIAVLYLNAEPCGYRGPGRDPDPIRCEANLADHLPVGTTLWVHSVMESGSMRSKPYRGPGKALKDG